MQGYRPFPDDNPWNQDISALPKDLNSDLYLATIGSHPLHPDFGTVWNGVPIGIPYAVVGGNPAKIIRQRNHMLDYRIDTGFWGMV